MLIKKLESTELCITRVDVIADSCIDVIAVNISYENEWDDLKWRQDDKELRCPLFKEALHLIRFVGRFTKSYFYISFASRKNLFKHVNIPTNPSKWVGSC